jgi:hypothetical protein
MKHYVGDDTATWIKCDECGAFIMDSFAFMKPAVQSVCGCGTYKPVVIMIPKYALAIWNEVEI